MRTSPVLFTLGLLMTACAADGDNVTQLLSSSTTTSPTTTAATEAVTVLPIETLEPGDHEFMVGERLYLVHVPAGLGDEPAPVIMSLHGGGGSAPQHKDQIHLDPIADREGFVAVYPDGNGVTRLHTWNAGPYCCGVAAREDIDDVTFLADVLTDLALRMPIDSDRVAVAGHSNGAMMASRFAGERPDLVGAVIAVAAVAAPNQVPDQPVPMLQIHSVDDPRALYEGGEGPPFPGTSSTVIHVGAMETIEAWADANKCGDSVTETEPVVADNGHTATWIEWNDCSARLVHYRLTGAGHGWPGSTGALEAVVGPSTTVIDASEEVWAFAEAVFSVD